MWSSKDRNKEFTKKENTWLILKITHNSWVIPEKKDQEASLKKKRKFRVLTCSNLLLEKIPMIFWRDRNKMFGTLKRRNTSSKFRKWMEVREERIEKIWNTIKKMEERSFSKNGKRKTKWDCRERENKKIPKIWPELLVPSKRDPYRRKDIDLIVKTHSLLWNQNWKLHNKF